jgi:ribosomal protein L37AE/L43A
MMAALTGSSIHDVLARAGVEHAQASRGKMVCPVCKQRKVTASESKGIATCWGCEAHWTVTGEESTAPDRDWGTYLLTRIASLCLDHLPACIEARDWLDHRLIPTKSWEWLADQDLGAVPPILPIKDLVLAGKQLLQDAIGLLQAKQARTMQAATVIPKDLKLLRAAQRECATIDAAIEKEQKEFEHLTQVILPLLLDSKWRNALVYCYRDEDNQPCSLNIRQYSTEPGERTVMRIQPRPGKRGVFGVGEAQYAVGAAWQEGFPPLTIVEGEHNLLALQAAVRRWGIEYHIPAIAVGGKSGADIACVRALSNGGEPLVIFDNDKPDPVTGMPGGYDLVDAVATQMYCHAATTPTKDMDDYLRGAPGIGPDKVYWRILASSKLVPISIKTIRTRVESYLCAKIEGNAREIAVTEMIVADVKRRTKLFNVDGYALLLLPAGDLTSDYVSVREGDAGFHAFLRQYGISKPEWVDACGRALNIESTKRDTPCRTLHSIAAWLNGNLYINCYEGSMIRISVEDNLPVLDRVPVGEDGVLMRRYAHSLTDTEAKTRPWLNPDFDLESIKPGSLRHNTASMLDVGILDRVIYMEDAPHYKQLLKCWILSTFFATTQKSRPVPMLEGTGGGGKTTVGVALGNVLIGEHFSATNAPATGKELAELMTGVPFVVFDEWSNIPKEVEKAFKHLSTGGKHRRRELYTTSTVVELGCDASIMLTTNANPTKEVATSRRFIVVPVAARQTVVGERVFSSTGEHLLPELMSLREDIWVELLSDLSACVLALHHTDPATKTSFSMADFGVFVQRIANYEGWGETAHRMFISTEKKQEQQTADTQALAALVPEFFRFRCSDEGKFYTAREWSDNFLSVIPENDRELRSKVTANYVSWVFKAYADLYQRRFGLQEGKDLHTKTKTYSLRLPQDTEQSRSSEQPRLTEQPRLSQQVDAA